MNHKLKTAMVLSAAAADRIQLSAFCGGKIQESGSQKNRAARRKAAGNAEGSVSDF